MATSKIATNPTFNGPHGVSVTFGFFTGEIRVEVPGSKEYRFTKTAFMSSP
jgi:hypothetical protein